MRQPKSIPDSLNVAGQIGGQASPGAAAMAYSKGTHGRIRPRPGGQDAGLCGEFTAASAGDDSCLWHAYLRRGAQHGAEARRSPRSPFRQNRRSPAHTSISLPQASFSSRRPCAVTQTIAKRLPLSSPSIAAPSLASSPPQPHTKGRSMSSIACMRRAWIARIQQAGSQAAISRPTTQAVKNETHLGPIRNAKER
jgi:hypothetical protein